MTDRKNIVILNKVDLYEAWGSLKELCENHENFSYHYLKRKKFPFNYKGYDFVKVPFRAKNTAQNQCPQ